MDQDHRVGTILGVVAAIAVVFVASYGCKTTEENKTDRLNIIAQYGGEEAVEAYALDHAP